MNQYQVNILGIGDEPSFSVSFSSWNQVMQDIRRGFKISQASIAKGFMYSPQQIARFESGKVEPPIDFWRKFSDRFGVNIAWLMFGEGPVGIEAPTDPSMLRGLNTKDLVAEITQRKRVLSGFLRKAGKIRQGLLTSGPGSGEGFQMFLGRVRMKQEALLPPDSPKWLIEDFREAIR